MRRIGPESVPLVRGQRCEQLCCDGSEFCFSQIRSLLNDWTDCPSGSGSQVRVVGYEQPRGECVWNCGQGAI